MSINGKMDEYCAIFLQCDTAQQWKRATDTHKNLDKSQIICWTNRPGILCKVQEKAKLIYGDKWLVFYGHNGGYLWESVIDGERPQGNFLG